MGYFTWTFANRQIKETKYGYARSCVLEYGNRGYIALPKGITYEGCVYNSEGYAFIKEDFYDGYGMFGKYDVYDIVADLNKQDAVEFLSREGATWGDKLLPIAKAWLAGKSEEEIIEVVKANGFETYPEEWKRHIGISMSCYDRDQELLKYPLKIVSSTRCRYEDLPYSHSTQ